MHTTTISMGESDLKTIILEVVTTYEHYLQVNQELQQENRQQKYQGQSLEDDEILTYKRIVYVPNSWELRKLEMNEMHNVPYARHSRYQQKLQW